MSHSSAQEISPLCVLLKKNATGITTRQNASSFFFLFFFFLRKFLRKESFREDFRDERHTNVYSSSRFEKQRETRKAEERGREVLTRKQRDSPKKKVRSSSRPPAPCMREREREKMSNARDRREIFGSIPLSSLSFCFFFLFFLLLLLCPPFISDEIERAFKY